MAARTAIVGEVSRCGAAGVLLVFSAAVCACRGILGIEDRPDLGSLGEGGVPRDAVGDGVDAGVPTDAPGDVRDAASEDADPVDLDWAAWPLPGIAPEPSAFKVSGNVVTDSVTGLMWQRTTTARIQLPEARTHCAASAEGGFTDWRLPRWIELVSIADYTGNASALVASAFPTPPAYLEWADSRYWFAGLAPAVNLASGAFSPIPPTFLQSVARCVRGEPLGGRDRTAPAVRYTIANGTVRDEKTKKTWQAATSGSSLSVTSASAYCTGLALGGFAKGWRMPDIKELLSILDAKAPVEPRWHQPAFGATVTRELWSSTHSAGDARDVWYVDFGTATQGSDDENIWTHPVKCVRD
jgi:hypothetical protein